MSDEIKDPHMRLHDLQNLTNKKQIDYNDNQIDINKELLKRIEVLEGHVEFILTSSKGIYKDD